MESPVRPPPRLTARSILSFGTLDFLAFWMASARVGLPERSGPPTFAATSMFLMSLAKDLARRASMTAFLCLVVAHLEWPDIRLLVSPAYSRQSVRSPPRIRLVAPSPQRPGEADHHR